MIKHQSLTSDEMVTLSYLAQASYSDSPNLSLNAKTSKWEAITSELTSYGLSQSALVGNSYNKVGQYGYGDANAVLFRNNATNELAIGFRGTEVPKGDPLFWFAIGNHYSLFTEFIQSCEKYIADKNPSKVQITGHSLGGAMAERFMEQFQDESLA